MSACSNVVVLSDGHVFAAGSVVHIGPIDKWSEGFYVTGIGFSVSISNPYSYYEPNSSSDPDWPEFEEEVLICPRDKFIALREEYIAKLIGKK